MKKPIAAEKVTAGLPTKRRKHIKMRAKELTAMGATLSDISELQAVPHERAEKKL